MPDLAASLQTAKQAGYSDKQIADYLASDPSLGSKVGTARQAGYSDADIVGHLAGSTAAPPPAAPAPPAKENFFQKAGRITAQEYQGADQAYRADVQNIKSKMTPGNSPNLIDEARPVLDATRAALSPVKGVMDAAFGEKPVELPFGINKNGMTPGDIASFAIPMAGEASALRTTAKAADAAGVSLRTMDATLKSSRAAQSNALMAGKAAAPAQPNALQETVQQFDKAGVRPTMAAAGEGNSRVAKAIAENPIAGLRSRSNLQASLNDTSGAVERAAQQYGQPATRGAAGEAVQAGVKGFNDRFSERAGKLYDKAFGSIDAAMAGKTDPAQTSVVHDPDFGSVSVQHGGSQISTPATSAVIGGMNEAQSQAIAKVISDPTVSKLGAALKDANAAKDMSFQDLRSLRTKVRLAQQNDQLRQDIGAANLQRIEGALTQDITSNAERLAGHQAARQLKRADTFYRLGSQRIQGALQKFVGKSEDMAGENTYDRIQRMASDKGGADYARLTALNKSLQPHEWGDVAATTLSHMGQAPDGTFSVQRFVTGFDKLSPQGKDLLWGKGEMRDSLENLANVARKQQKVEQAANRSNTAVSAQALGTVAGLVNPHTAIPTALGLVGAGLTGEVLTNPTAVRFLARLGQAKTPEAVAAQVKVIDTASRRNAALLPLAQAARSIRFPQGAPLPAAASTSQEQATR